MQKIKTYIGFAVKSNHIIKGIDEILKSKKRIGLVFVVDGLKDNSQEKLSRWAETKGVSIAHITQDILNELNLVGVKVLGITDPNLVVAIKKELNI